MNEPIDWAEFAMSIGLILVIIGLAVACHAQVSAGVGG